MPDDRLSELNVRFDAAFGELAAARVAYEDQPRDPERIAALGRARIRLDDARTAMDHERRRLGLEPPWRLKPNSVTASVIPPPLWSIDHGPNS